MSYDESLCPIPPHRGGKGDGRAHDKRIRELEAELADFKRWLHESSDMVERYHARAEKAEEANVYNFQTMKRITAERDSLQVRAAELEAEIRVCVRHGMPLTKDEVKACEREAE